MATKLPVHSGHQRWKPDDIPWHTINRQLAANDEILFYLVASASFIEITTDLYTQNLYEYFSGDTEVQKWLQGHWEPEELQHGETLRRYVRQTWPDFEWHTAYQNFLEEYSRYCKVELLGPTRCRELAARCVVEMGTATYYTAISRMSREPVLSDLTRHIKEDEVRHYKYFYHYFLRYLDEEHTNRIKVLRTLWHRLREIDGEDGLIAIKHVYRTLHPNQPFSKSTYQSILKGCRQAVGEYFPHQMSVKMLIKPLQLSPIVQRAAVPVLEAVSRQFIG